MPPSIVQPPPVSAGSATLVSMASSGFAGFIVYSVYLYAEGNGHHLPDLWYAGLFSALQGFGSWFVHNSMLKAAEAKIIRDLQ